MASLFSKLVRIARSPQGRRAIEQARRAAKDPRTRQQAKEAVDRLRGRGKGPGAPPPAGR
ncbi:hypothetical protein B0I33_103527 [Prauserella shujinwangii]|uniref:Uncharacterized protein n=1 Tax=Prauserella shujinwangii TaxID=1453103 RepID=A0A2T0LZG5_9PSEU|nr:hypothetical protein [Prauserella shujinwangii]PRX49490.1 hypothetical protein B0I33_103527 [Prauserella shujinwangii]